MRQAAFTVNWNYPTDIRVGIGRVSELAATCQSLNLSAPLLVTDPGLAAMPMVTAVVEQCQQAGLNIQVFSALKGNPDEGHVVAGVQAFHSGQHDGVIAFGGGSALDVGKAIALLSGQHRPLWDFEDEGDNWQRVDPAGIAPVIAIPTTAGTGSEVGRASVITDNEQHLKRLIFHPGMLPKVVILDAQVTVDLPAAITAATGMDALSHNLEAYCSPVYHPMAKGIAIEGIRLVKDFLPTAVAEGDNLEARMHMLVASTMGATAFQKGLGAMHALAHPLGAVYDKHHGLLNAILMPYVLEANRAVIEKDIERLACYLQLSDTSFEGFKQWVLDLRQLLSIPYTLSEIGIDDQQAERIAQMAVDDPSAATNPISFNMTAYKAIFSEAVG